MIIRALISAFKFLRDKKIVLAVAILMVLAVYSILVALVKKHAGDFVGGIVAGALGLTLAVIFVFCWKYRNS